MAVVIPPGIVPQIAFLVILAGTAIVVVSRLPKALTLSAVIAVVFGLQMLDWIGIVRWLGFIPAVFLDGDVPFSILTHMYVHADLAHLVGNLVVLVSVGSVFEDRIGDGWFVVAFFLGGLAGGVATIALGLALPALLFTPSVGASSGAFAVLTVVAVLYPRRKIALPLMFFILRLPALAFLLIYLVYNIGLMFGPAGGVAWWGHFAGFLVGLPLGLALERRGPTGLTFPDLDALRPYATSDETRRILSTLERMAASPTKDDEAYAAAWLERFFAKAACDRCGEPMRVEGRVASCANGHSVEPYARPTRLRVAFEE